MNLRHLPIIALLSAAGCLPTSSQTVTVLHEVTGEPLAGVEVTPYYSTMFKPTFDKATTGPDGRATLNLAWGRRYGLSFEFKNGERRSVWLQSQSGWTFRLWPEPYRLATLVLPDDYRGLVYVANVVRTLTNDYTAATGPAIRIGPGEFTVRQQDGLPVLDEAGKAHAKRVEAAQFADGRSVPVESWWGPSRPDVAARPIGVWGDGPDAGTTVYCVGTLADAEHAAGELQAHSVTWSGLSRHADFAANRRYQEQEN